MASLIGHDIALYAAHLPLDMHEEFGNNAGLARQLGLVDLRPFGSFRKVKIGFAGRLPEPGSIDSVLARLGMGRDEALGILSFGPEKISTVAVISGGADKEVDQAIAEGADLYVTGELSHQVYHTCQESGINLIAAGHYRTEIVGVQLVAEKLKADMGIETCFIDLPTGL
jgi:dinuclear metal center YbgI/SA1388 family protein